MVGNSYEKNGGVPLVVLCCSCDKIKDDAGKWVAGGKLPEQSPGIIYSHAVCPDCMQRLYGKEEWYESYVRAVLAAGGVRAGEIKFIGDK